MIEIFRRLASEIAGHTQPTGTQFHFPNRIVIFPEMRCPYCERVIRCHRIFHIKEGRVPYYWDVVRSPSRGRGRRRGWRLICRRGWVHPHVGASTYVCMGTAKTEEQALFMGIYPEESYWTDSEIFDWLETVWSHDCPAKPDDLE